MIKCVVWFTFFTLGFALQKAYAVSNEISITDIISGKGDPRTNSYLNMIFGELFEGPAEETLISALIFNFNVILFSVGLVIFLYNIVVGTVDTANEGEVLGSRYSAAWVPIRIVCAAAALAPVLPGGYSPAQAVVAYAAKTGPAAATFFWEQTAKIIIEQKLPVIAADTDSLDGQFLQGLFRMEVCRAVYNLEVAKGGEEMKGIGRSWVSDSSGSMKLVYDLDTRAGACGTVSLPGETVGFRRIAENAKTEEQVQTDPSSKFRSFLEGMKKNVDFMADHYAAVANELAEKVSRRQALPPYLNLAADMKTWRDRQAELLRPYMGAERINQSAKQTFGQEEEISVIAPGNSTPQKLSINVTGGGWSQAGFYYQLIARLSSDANSVGSLMPVITPGDAIGGAGNPNGPAMQSVASQYAANSTYILGSAEGDAKKFLNQITATYNGTVDWWNESVTRSGIKAFTNERMAFADSGGDLANILPSSGAMTESIALFAPTSTVIDPMNAVIIFGTQMVGLATIATLAISVAGMFPLVGGAATALGTILGPGILFMLTIGSSFGFVLPLMPSIIWVLAIGSYFILIVEAIFAAPLWAIAHLSMGGHGFAGDHAKRGYVLFLSLLLTPVLMLFGLLVGMVLFRILGNLINTGLYYALTSAQSLNPDTYTSYAWYAGIVVISLFMLFVYVIIIELSFSLIASFPGRVFRWFADIGDQLDSQSNLRAGLSAGAQYKAASDVLGGLGAGVNSVNAKRVYRKRDTDK